jgi:hypothetical protein
VFEIRLGHVDVTVSFTLIVDISDRFPIVS